jgi:hypothetical protein
VFPRRPVSSKTLAPQFFRKVKKLEDSIFAVQRLPARLTADQAASLLGFEEHDIPKLVQKRILKPLGHPAKNCVKHFWLDDVLDLAKDRDLLAKAEDACRRGPSKRQADVLNPSDTAEAA